MLVTSAVPKVPRNFPAPGSTTRTGHAHTPVTKARCPAMPMLRRCPPSLACFASTVVAMLALPVPTSAAETLRPATRPAVTSTDAPLFHPTGDAPTWGCRLRSAPR
jgi:hypothetical protein